ncbi:MAG: hypothetical protein ACOYMB_03285 [Patescibacteria group bacterium]
MSKKTKVVLEEDVVVNLFFSLLFRDNEIVDGKPIVEPRIGEGICVEYYEFFPARLEANSEKIKSMIFELPHEFMKSCGGGESLLSACVTRNGVRWTNSEETLEKLFAMGNALGLSDYVKPREVWAKLPNGMPYVTVFDKLDGETKSVAYTNVEKASLRHFFFSVLDEEKPELGIYIRDTMDCVEMRVQNGWVTIYVAKAERMTVGRLLEDSAIELLIHPEFLDHREFGMFLEQSGKLPKGTTDSLVARYSSIKAKEYNDPNYCLELVKSDPISDKKLKNLMKNAIKAYFLTKE